MKQSKKPLVSAMPYVTTRETLQQEGELMFRYAIAYARASVACPCAVQPCGAIIPVDDCPDHGHRKILAMERHAAGSAVCRRLDDQFQGVCG